MHRDYPATRPGSDMNAWCHIAIGPTGGAGPVQAGSVSVW